MTENPAKDKDKKMLFNSYIFVAAFLPLCMIGYFLLNKINNPVWARIFLLGMSLWFYGYFNKKYLLIIVVSVLFNYSVYRILLYPVNRMIHKVILAAAVLFNLGLLFGFKYYNFFVGNINSVFKADFPLHHLILPLGISFFTFQQLSFIIDSYQGKIPKYPVLTYALFVTYFPQLIAGPIVTYDELVPQLEDKTKRILNWHHVAQGLYLFVMGLAKKVLIADTFGNAANWGFDNLSVLNSGNAVIVMLSYTIQIYFDFSGYSDMALGIAKMMNIDLPVNFNSPYKSLTITEFWDRWHMTLTRFFSRYVYIPLGGNRKGRIRTYLNMLLVFLFSGLWHGANWTFIIWGGMHGLFSVLTRWKKDLFAKLHPLINWTVTFLFINLTWIVFRADSVGDAVKMIRTIFSMQFQGVDENITACFRLQEFLWLFEKLHLTVLNGYPCFCMILFFAIICIGMLGTKNAYERMISFHALWRKSIITALLLVWCIFSFAGISTFLYFNF